MPEMSCKLKTGDLLLCDDLQYSSWGLFSWFIKFMTKSDFSHVGMIVVDPVFTDVPLKGAYVWMSGISDVPDPEDNTKKFGVQLVPYDHFITTYGGKIYAIDRYLSPNGKYRVLVSPDPDDEPWPEALRFGSGTSNMLLLNDVPIWYELWRKINGFPPDFYKITEPKSNEK